MSEHVIKLLTLYENGNIDGDALNTALKALNAPSPQEPQKKTLTDTARERRRRKKKRRKQRKAEIAANQKMKHPENPHFSLWIKPNVVISERMKFPSSATKTP